MVVAAGRARARHRMPTPVVRRSSGTAQPVMSTALDFSRVRVHTSDHGGVVRRQAPAAPRTPAPPPATTEDCEPWQTRMLNEHLSAARTWVDDATSKITTYANIHASSRHTAVPASPATDAVVATALRENFHTTEPGHVLQIRDGFQSLRPALNSQFTYECEDDCSSKAYVRGRFAFIRRLGDIHVCPLWYGQDYFNRVRTLVHERAHQYPGADDNAYNWEPRYATLPPQDAVDNADSYATAARQIFHGGAHGPGT
jgi:hypothetical protein